MNTSNKNIGEDRVLNKRSIDPFDKLIFEKGLRIKQIMADKKLNTMIILLNNADALKVPLNYFTKLNAATQTDLDQWQLIGGGTGIHWQTLDEDLSLKGLIKESALTAILHRLEGKGDKHQLAVL